MIGDPEYKIGRPRQLFTGSVTPRRHAHRQTLIAAALRGPSIKPAGWHCRRAFFRCKQLHFL
jgi:hypothetical protein